MNVFVLGTGRCGTVTFSRACMHIHNYTTGHESRVRYLLGHSVDFPDNHIEVDCRLSWRLGWLQHRFADAFYVHLKRDSRLVERSYVRKYMSRDNPHGQLPAWIRYHGAKDTREQVQSIACDMVKTLNMNIAAFLRDKEFMEIGIDDAAGLFPAFCDRIKASVDMEAAVAEFGTRHNSADNPSG